MEPLPLPNFDPGKAYAISGATLNLLLRAHRQRTPRPGRNTSTQETPDGILIHASPQGSATALPFTLSVAAPDKIDVSESTINSTLVTGFTAGKKQFTIVGTSGVIYAKITISGTTGAVTAVAVEIAATLPANTSTAFHDPIGNYVVTGSGDDAVLSCNNLRYGPIPVSICQDFFAAEAPFFGVTFL